MKKQLFEIKWIDSMSSRGWRSLRETEEELWSKDVEITSVGYLFKKSKQKIAIFGSFDHQTPPNINHYHEIPTSCILSIRKIK